MKEIPGKLGWAYAACFLKPLRKEALESEFWGGKQDHKTKHFHRRQLYTIGKRMFLIRDTVYKVKGDPLHGSALMQETL